MPLTQVAKLCNNLSLAVSMIGTCEAFALGEKLGIDPKVRTYEPPFMCLGIIDPETTPRWGHYGRRLCHPSPPARGRLAAALPPPCLCASTAS